MQYRALLFALCATLCVAACGDGDKQPAETDGANKNTPMPSGTLPVPGGIALAGEGWDGGTGLDPTHTSEKVRVIAFFKPG